MTLLDLIRTPASRLAATAIPAIPAIPAIRPDHAARTVAKIATVAVAKPADAKPVNRATPSPCLLRKESALSAEGLGAVPACPAEVAECSAIIDEGNHCARNATNRPALAKAGYGCWQALGDAHRRHVAAALNALPQPTDQKGIRLIAETRHFLGSNWFRQALKCGWTLEGLFGVDALAPLERLEQWGLIVGLALAPKPGDVIEHLDAENAVIRYRVGSLPKEARRIERRFVPADSSVPWWKCSALVSEAKWFTQLSEPS